MELIENNIIIDNIQKITMLSIVIQAYLRIWRFNRIFLIEYFVLILCKEINTVLLLLFAFYAYLRHFWINVLTIVFNKYFPFFFHILPLRTAFLFLKLGGRDR